MAIRNSLHHNPYVHRKNEHEPVIYVHYVDETGFVNELISYIDLSAQGETEGPIRSFLMFIEPSKFAALQSKIHFICLPTIFLSLYQLQNMSFQN